MAQDPPCPDFKTQTIEQVKSRPFSEPPPHQGFRACEDPIAGGTSTANFFDQVDIEASTKAAL